ncbi:twin-arginine translocation signal domain-containing protein [Sedimenticola sp.]|uniref:twin-arginine translocation signal domain-containing protein n=1 Tax=Sedimenticola sp. TaxID=1940285 RepID=UPI003D128557
MKDDSNKTLDSGRREFIRGSLVTGVGVATAAVLPGTVMAAEESSSAQTKVQQGYRLTAHILEYYKTTAS